MPPARLRICLLDTEQDFEGQFRDPFDKLDGVDTVVDCHAWQPLSEHIRMGQVDVVAVNLDTADPNAGLLHVSHIGEINSDVGIIGVSRKPDPDVIIAAMRAGCSQFVRWPVEQQDLREAITRLRRTPSQGVPSCQRYCVVGSSGGAGATTIACNLALELADGIGRACALIDLDLQFGDVACSFDIHPEHSIADICGPGIEIDRTLVEMAMRELTTKVAILARPEQLDQAQDINADAVFEMFRIVEQMFPFAVVDLPRYIGPATMAALHGADRVFIVAQLTIPHLRNALRMYDYLVSMGADEERIEIILNRTKAQHERISPKDVEQQFRRPVFGIVPNDYKRIGAARDLGQPLMVESPNAPARRAIHDMAQKLLAQAREQDPSIA